MIFFKCLSLRDTTAAILIAFLIKAVHINSNAKAFDLQSLPRIHVSDLSTQTFDEAFLDKKPLILAGTTICPTGMDFSTLQTHCRGNIPSNYVHTKSKTKSVWAGLQAGDKKQMIDFNEWSKHMQKGDNESDDEDPQFLFDVPMVEICPYFYGKVSIPEHFIGTFASQFQHRKANVKRSESLRKGKETDLMDDSKETDTELLNELCTNLPFFNIYMAEKSFQTDLHIDAGHTSFMASMCVGRKRWRVMTNQDYAKAYNQIGLEGIPMNGKHIMGTIRSPFNTWSKDNSNDLHVANVTIYEGILNPGELLYIPAGFPHAATTLDNSIMIASNDHSFGNLEEGVAFCDQIDNDHVACSGFRQKHQAFVQNEEMKASMKRQETPVPQSTGCEKTYQLLLDVNERNDVVEILPTNFHLYVQNAPMIILKSQKNCGFCLYLLKHWDQIISAYNPPIQFGIMNCFQGQCQYGDNVLYQQLQQRLEGVSSPQLLFLSLDRNKNTLEFVDYYGQYSLNDIRVWASYNSGSSITLEPPWYKLLWTMFHAVSYYTIKVTDKIGTTGLGLLLFSIIFSFFVIIAHWNGVPAHFSGNKKRKQQ